MQRPRDEAAGKRRRDDVPAGCRLRAIVVAQDPDLDIQGVRKAGVQHQVPPWLDPDRAACRVDRVEHRAPLAGELGEGRPGADHERGLRLDLRDLDLQRRHGPASR